MIPESLVSHWNLFLSLLRVGLTFQSLNNKTTTTVSTYQKSQCSLKCWWSGLEHTTLPGHASQPSLPQSLTSTQTATPSATRRVEGSFRPTACGCLSHIQQTQCPPFAVICTRLMLEFNPTSSSPHWKLKSPPGAEHPHSTLAFSLHIPALQQLQAEMRFLCRALNQPSQFIFTLTSRSCQAGGAQRPRAHAGARRCGTVLAFQPFST